MPGRATAASIAFAKVHAGDGAARERRATGAVRAALGAGNTHLRVPRAGGEGAALTLEALPGRRLDTLPPGAREHGLERLGAALATLHGLRPPAGVAFRRFTPERLARAVGVIATAQPAAGRAAAELLAALLGRHADAAGPAVCLHGDANPRNALLDGDRVSLIDLEDVAAGPAAADLGHVLAGLLCERVGRRAPGRGGAAARPRAAARIRGASPRCRRPETLAWHTAAAVLARRALTAVNRVREADLRRLDALPPRRAERWCDEADAAVLVPALRRARPPRPRARALRGARRAVPRRARVRRRTARRHRAAARRGGRRRCRRSASAPAGQLRQPRPAR